MLSLYINGDIIKEVSLSTLDPISLDSYGDIIKVDSLICMLICKTTRPIYRASDIIEMRYDILYNTVHVYFLKDPLSREEVKDVYFFQKEAKKANIVFKDKEVLISQMKFNYLCNEKEMFEDDSLKRAVLGYEYYDDDMRLYAWIFILVFTACIVLGILLKFLI